MSLNFKMYFCSAALLIALIANLTASTEETLSSIHLELTTLAWDTPVKGLYYMNQGRIEELKAYSGGFSMPFAYDGEPTIRFYIDKEALLLPLEERPPPNGIAQLSPTLKHALLIFLLKENEQYQIQTHDFSQKEFPPNSCRIFNFSGLRVVFAFGDQPIIQAIDPNAVIVVRQDDLADKNKMVKVQLAQHGQEALRIVYRSTWRFDNQARTTVFILPAPNDQSSVKMRKFVERGLKPE
jgi:hypothetical protein